MRRPSAEANTAWSHSFGDIKIVRGSEKTYVVMHNQKTDKWPLLVEVTKKHTPNHRMACERLMTEVLKKGLTKEMVQAPFIFTVIARSIVIIIAFSTIVTIVTINLSFAFISHRTYIYV